MFKILLSLKTRYPLLLSYFKYIFYKDNWWCIIFLKQLSLKTWNNVTNNGKTLLEFYYSPIGKHSVSLNSPVRPLSSLRYVRSPPTKNSTEKNDLNFNTIFSLKDIEKPTMLCDDE